MSYYTDSILKSALGFLGVFWQLLWGLVLVYKMKFFAKNFVW